MMYVNSIQVMLVPVLIILCVHSYITHIVGVDNFQVNAINHKPVRLDDGPLKINDVLDTKANIIWQEEGIISMTKLQDQLYMGTIYGEVLKYNPIKERIDTIIQFNAKITSIRPSEDGNLYLLSVCTGIFKLDLTTKRLMLVYDHRSKGKFLNPANATHLNDFLVTGSGDSRSFLIAQSSRRWTSRQLYYSHIEADQTGQLIRYTPKTDQVEIVKQGLAFPKGLELSDDKKSVLITEFVSRKVQRLHLTGTKEGQSELVIDHLPGEPNHIRRSLSKSETYWIALNSARNATNYGYLDMLSGNVIVKEVILYLIKGVEDMFLLLNRFLDSDHWIPRWNSYVFDWYLNDFKHGLILEIDSNGKILNALHSPAGKLTNIEEAAELSLNKEKSIFLTSAFNHFIAKLNI